MSGQILAVIAAVFAGAVTSLITGWLTRPKTKADAGLAIATGEVAISGDAREWAREFAARAQRAEDRAAAAQARCDGIEERAAAAEDRCDEIERRFDLAVALIRDQQHEIRQLGGHPLPVPIELIPPL